MRRTFEAFAPKTFAIIRVTTFFLSSPCMRSFMARYLSFCFSEILVSLVCLVSSSNSPCLASKTRRILFLELAFFCLEDPADPLEVLLREVGHPIHRTCLALPRRPGGSSSSNSPCSYSQFRRSFSFPYHSLGPSWPGSGPSASARFWLDRAALTPPQTSPLWLRRPGASSRGPPWRRG